MGKELGLKPLKAACQEQFQFGDGNVEVAKEKYFYPCFVKGIYRGVLDQAAVDVTCPQLLSKQVMEKWDVDLCMGKKKTKINKFNVQVPFSTEKQVPVVNIFDITPEQLAAEWHRIPNHFKMQASPPKARVKQKHVTIYGKDGKEVSMRKQQKLLDVNYSEPL